jgi:Protein of unknown function (DUF2442)
MTKQHNIQSINFKADRILLEVDGQSYQIPIHQASPILAQASDRDRHLHRIAPSGYDIHWFTLDEDLSINGLLKIAQPCR